MTRHHFDPDEIEGLDRAGYERLLRAVDTVGRTHAEQLTWIWNFSHRVLDDAAARIAGDELLFLVFSNAAGASSYEAFADARPFIPFPNPGSVRSIQNAVRNLLDELEPGKVVELPVPVYDAVVWSDGRVVPVTYEANDVQLVLATVVRVLIDIGLLLRRCTTPTCRRLFVAKRSQQVRCTLACGNHDRLKRWRAQHRDALADQQHSKYVRRKKAATSHSVKVQRRRRMKGAK